MRKSLWSFILLVAVFLPTVGQARGCRKPPPQNPNTMILYASYQVVDLDFPYGSFMFGANVYFEGELVEPAPNATGTYTTASGNTVNGDLGVRSNKVFPDLKLPGKWRFKIDDPPNHCSGAWGPTVSVPLAGTYDFKCYLTRLAGDVISATTGGFGTDEDEVETIDPTDIGPILEDNVNEFMWPGDALVSANGDYILLYQADGNLVKYDAAFEMMWESDTDGSGGGGAHVHLQEGDLVIYDSGVSPVWSSESGGNEGAFLLMQNDGNLVIYDAFDTPIWSTGMAPAQRPVAHMSQAQAGTRFVRGAALRSEKSRPVYLIRSSAVPSSR